MPFIPLIISRRRERIADPAPELAKARKRSLIIVTTLCVLILGGAALIEFVRS